MDRLTTDHPNGNWENTLNFVYGKDGWAHIRDDGENEDVPLHDWIKRQCLAHGCDDFPADTPSDIDELVCDCAMDCPSCTVAITYVLASQAVHLRDRLKTYEDIMFSADGSELITREHLASLRAHQEEMLK